MTKKIIFVLSIGAAFFAQAQDASTITNTAEIYSNSNLPGTAKSNGMAGSIGALGGDISSVNVNPAGLGVFITSSMSGTLNINNSTTTSEFNGSSQSYDLNNTSLGQIGGAIAFEGKKNSPWKFVTVGFNFSNQDVEKYVETPGGTGVNYPVSLYDSNNNPVTGNLAFGKHAYNRYGTISKMNLGLGGNYNHRLYVGAGINLSSASIEQYDSAAYSLNLADNQTYQFDRQYTPFSEESSGVSLSLGVIGKVTDQIRLGAAIESPTWWGIQRVYSEYDDTYGDAEYFNEDRTLSSPMKLTLSGAFVPTKNLAINVDYGIGLSQPKYEVQGQAETDLNNYFQDNYENASDLRVGAEYRVQAFRLRGGYATTTGGFANDNFVGKREVLAAGVGYDFKSFYLDAAYQNINSDYNNVFGGGTYYTYNNNDGTAFQFTAPTAQTGTVNQKNNMISLTAGWKF